MDSKLLEIIYNKYARELYLYLYSLCKDRSTAEDLMQETFAKAILALSDNHPNFRAWLYQVGRNLCFNYMKKQGTLKPLDEVQERATDEDALSGYIRNEENRILYDRILKLPDDQRQVVVLFYFAECSTGEIAEIMGLKQGYVRMLLTRARRNLKNLLAE